MSSYIDRIFKEAEAKAKANRDSPKPRLTREQKKALEAYNSALREEDRYLGSIFANSVGQRRVEAVTRAAYERCKALGMDHRHGL